MNLKVIKRNAPAVLFVASAAMLIFSLGAVSYKLKFFPVPQFEKLISLALSVIEKINVYDQWYYSKTPYKTSVVFENKSAMQPGLTKVTSVSTNGELAAKVIDGDGNTVHEWNVDWFRIWPNPTHLPEDIRPKSKPGTMMHGSLVTDDGGLIFNYDGLGLVRLDACSNVVWRLAEMTHHSLYLDDSGDLWVPGVIFHDKAWDRLPNFWPEFREEYILRVSQDGKVLERISIVDLLEKNNLLGLMYARSPSNFDTKNTGDVLHLNDVEVFPDNMESGLFSAGDMMISLRNVGAVLVFAADNHNIKYMSIGRTVRQHDPDFVDGNTISIFDNHNMDGASIDKASRILVENALDHSVKVYFTGTASKPFYSSALGKHQWLENGNLLLTESISGRALEIDRDGNIVWDFENIVADGYKGAIGDAERLDVRFTKELFASQKMQCQSM